MTRTGALSAGVETKEATPSLSPAVTDIFLGVGRGHALSARPLSPLLLSLGLSRTVNPPDTGRWPPRDDTRTVGAGGASAFFGELGTSGNVFGRDKADSWGPGDTVAGRWWSSRFGSSAESVDCLRALALRNGAGRNALDATLLARVLVFDLGLSTGVSGSATSSAVVESELWCGSETAAPASEGTAVSARGCGGQSESQPGGSTVGESLGVCTGPGTGK
mmetsp:Transcript_9032/g.20741  ORF Transcript_9032/g.20741 Transcript_9032/m.20741 type:complete len:220 (+) Transcript_9032:437-1096(+)